MAEKELTEFVGALAAYKMSLGCSDTPPLDEWGRTVRNKRQNLTRDEFLSLPHATRRFYATHELQYQVFKGV